VGGLVRSASVDLGEQGHLVNGVLPGVLDTPMTAANLDPEQIAAVASMTSLGRLPDLDTLAELICFLCSPDNNSITGQSIAVDLGMSNVRLL
jgi:NAD(P)-dependent dehydrogenase (short-subunit alcohol dehydrogenase family)